MRGRTRAPHQFSVLQTILVSAAAAPQTFFYGGQAVIEGVLMRGPDHYAIAAREPSGAVVIERQQLKSKVYTSKIWRRPFLRGVAGLVEMFHLGFNAIQWSANVQLGEQLKISPRAMRVTVAGSVAFSLLLFIGAPAAGGHLFHTGGGLATVGIEGVLRAVILMAYLGLIGLVPNMRRLFAYHGAEHKTINCFEHGDPLDVEHVMKASRLHPRCGTGFIVLVGLVSVVVFAPLAPLPLGLRLIAQVVLAPVVAAVAYEAIRALTKIRTTPIGRVLLLPVLGTQLLTTRQPDASQIEVALRALAEARRDEATGELATPELLSA